MKKNRPRRKSRFLTLNQFNQERTFRDHSIADLFLDVMDLFDDIFPRIENLEAELVSAKKIIVGLGDDLKKAEDRITQATPSTTKGTTAS